MSSLASVFLAALQQPAVGTVDVERLELELERATVVGARANADLVIPAPTFASHLGARAASATALQAMAIEDSYLACGCCLGDDTAVELFQARFAPEIALALGKVPDAISMVDEITQLVIAQLMLPDASGKRGIESYRGRGGLFSWLRVITVRRALRELSKTQRNVPLGDEQILASLEQTPELGYMKELYRDAFRQAFARSWGQLDYEERTLLRHHYVHTLSIDKLSVLHKVHRATAARRLAKARDQLLQTTRRQLLTELRVSADELDSIMRLIASNLDASMAGLLTTES